MNLLDARANADFRAANNIHQDLKLFEADARASQAAAGSGHADFGGNLGILSISNTTSVGTTGDFTNQDINGILHGTAWDVTGGQHITFSFPTSGSFYGAGYGSNEPSNGFTVFTADQQNVVRYALGLISQYTGITFDEVSETNSTHATLRFAGSTVPPTSWAYYPAASTEGGDVWLGNVKDVAPTKAGYAFDTIMHEIGHAMGLKHGHQNDGAHGVLPANHDSTEWSLMTYHSYVGADDYYRNVLGSGNQSYMIDDISALQYMYGADFSTYAGKTVYHWSTTTGEMTINGAGQGASATNTVYEALWDGGGVDIYDLRNYSSDLQVDLNPGEWSTFDTAQLADLDSGDPGVHFAHGNIANAHLYNDDRRSLIERAYGGGGADTITGNIAKNYLVGGAGDDHLDGAIGADLLWGGRGEDTFTGGAGRDAFAFRALTDSTVDHMDLITDLALSDTIDVSRIDANTRKAGDQAFHIVHNFSGHAAEMVVHYDSGSGRTIVSMDVDGDRTADSAFAIDGNHHTFSNFVL